MTDITSLARSDARCLRVRDMIRNGSEEACELRQSPEYRAAKSLDDAANEIERMREALYHADEGCKYTHLYDENKYTQRED